MEDSLEPKSPGRNVRLLLDSDEDEPSRGVICVSGEEGCGESGSDLAPSDPELDSTVVVWSRINPRKESKNEDKDAVYPEIQKLLDEPVPSGSKDDCGTPSRSKPKVGMNINKVMKSGSSSKIADSRSYTYDHIVLGEAE